MRGWKAIYPTFGAAGITAGWLLAAGVGDTSKKDRTAWSIASYVLGGPSPWEASLRWCPGRTWKKSYRDEPAYTHEWRGAGAPAPRDGQQRRMAAARP